VEKLEAGPKGMVVQFRRNKFRNPAGLVAWMAQKRSKDPNRDLGEMRLRPDHKLALVREMTHAQRIRIAREVAGNLNRLAEEGAEAAKG
jgi:transcription-repair coupling factor (superfamily II helicase)